MTPIKSTKRWRSYMTPARISWLWSDHFPTLQHKPWASVVNTFYWRGGPWAGLERRKRAVIRQGGWVRFRTAGLTLSVFVFRWSIPLGARRIMEAVKEGHKNTLSSGKVVALAAGLSVGATVGYIIYRHISSTNNSECLPMRPIFPDFLYWLMLILPVNRSGDQHWGFQDDASIRSL